MTFHNYVAHRTLCKTNLKLVVYTGGLSVLLSPIQHGKMRIMKYSIGAHGLYCSIRFFEVDVKTMIQLQVVCLLCTA